MVEGLEALFTRFPGNESAIRRLYFRDDEFRSLCGDYCDAMAARLRWQGVDVRADEYAALVIELELEIRTFLNERPDCLDEGREKDFPAGE